MATIKVDSTAMRDKASTFKTIAKNINAYTDEISQEVMSMKSVWEGEAAESAVKKFETFKQAFEEKKLTIENYAAFLEQAADVYDKSEDDVRNGAGN